jgi:hypothetical protein
MGSAASLPERIDFDTCKQLAGSRFSREVFDAYKDPKDNTISRDKLLQLNQSCTTRSEEKSPDTRKLNWNCWEIDEQEMRPMGSVSIDNWQMPKIDSPSSKICSEVKSVSA